jgi:hypothetical protein
MHQECGSGRGMETALRPIFFFLQKFSKVMDEKGYDLVAAVPGLAGLLVILNRQAGSLSHRTLW